MEFLAVVGSAGFGAGLTYLLTHPASCYDCTDPLDRIAHCGGQTASTVCKTVFNTAPMGDSSAGLLSAVVGLAAGGIALAITAYRKSQQRAA